MDLLEWWNLIFVLPALAALLYLLLLAFGAVDTGSDVSADVDADLDVDVEADLDADVDAGAAHGIEHALGAEHDAGETRFGEALGFLGFGRVPLSILLMTFCFLWGFTGWAVNTILKDALDRPAVFVVFSLAAATTVSIFGTRYLARGLARILPSTESYGSTERDLVGRLAKVRDAVTEHHGRVQLYDAHGSLQEVPVRIKPGQAEIPARSEVVLLSYDRTRGVYYVLADPLGEAGDSGDEPTGSDNQNAAPATRERSQE
jgi:membrane protein implicated in regulation of membrane protease activity